MWVVCWESDDYSYDDWELIGVFSTEAKADEAKALYIQGKSVDECDITVRTLCLDERYWETTKMLAKKEEEERNAYWAAQHAKASEHEAAKAAEREATEQARQLRVAALIAECEKVSIFMAPHSTEEDIELAKQLVDDARVCARRAEDPFWSAKRPAVTRRVKWAIAKLDGKMNLDEYLPSFECLEL